MLELNPENVVFFQSRYDNVLGTLMGPASDKEFGRYNTDSIVIVDKTKVADKNAARFKESQEKGYGGGSRRRGVRRSTRKRYSTRKR